MANDISFFPVSEITVGNVPSKALLLIRFDFLTNMLQPVDEANTGPVFALTAIQARYVIQSLERLLPTVESGEIPDSESPRH
jgi:hypothetical protein